MTASALIILIGSPLATAGLLYLIAEHWGFGADYWRTHDPELRVRVRTAARIRRTWPRLARDLTLTTKPTPTRRRGGSSRQQTRLRIPRITRTTVEHRGVIVDLITAPGVGRAEFARRAEDLTNAWRALRVVIGPVRSGRLQVRAVYHDPSPDTWNKPDPAAVDESLAGFDPSVRAAAHMLLSPWDAPRIWAAVQLSNAEGHYPEIARDSAGAPRIQPTAFGARAHLRMLLGQSRSHYQAILGELAVMTRVQEIQVLDVGAGHLALDLRTIDPLANAIPAPAPPESVDLTALPVGMREDGHAWTVPLLYRNILGVGVQGSGKSGFMRAAVLATAPAARDGLVHNLMIDMKFGLEAAQLRGLVHETATSEVAVAAMLRWLRHDIVETRGRRMEAAGIDKHVPTVDEPMYHLVVDEIAELLDNPDTRREFLRLMRSLLRLGRALGVSISAYTQNPQKQVLDLLRDLFHIRIGLRLSESSQLTMVYGSGAAERGARNLSIPDVGAEGTAYVVEETGRIVRVRAFEVPGALLAWAAQHYPPYERPAPESLPTCRHGGDHHHDAEVVAMPRKRHRPPTPAVPPPLPSSSVRAIQPTANDNQ